MDMTKALIEYSARMAARDLEEGFPFRKLFRSTSSIRDIYTLGTYSQAEAKDVCKACVLRLWTPRDKRTLLDSFVEGTYQEFCRRAFGLPYAIPDVRMLRGVFRENIPMPVAFGEDVCRLLLEFGVDWRSESALAAPKGLKKKANSVLQSFFPRKSPDWDGSEYEFSAELGDGTTLEAHVDYGGLRQMRLKFCLYLAGGGRLRFGPGHLVGSPTLWWDLICEGNLRQAIEDLEVICDTVAKMARSCVEGEV